jgi:hypothetical protein
MTADFTSAAGPVTVNLAARTASLFTSTSSHLSHQAPMLTGNLGWSATPLFTVGDKIGNWSPVGKLDGLAAWKLDSQTVRVLVNHEVVAGKGTPFTVSNNDAPFTLTGARIDMFDINIATKEIRKASSVITEIHNRNGALISDASGLENNGFTNFCASTLVKAQEFGAGRGLADTIYFTGEETTIGPGGSLWALDVATGAIWALPDFGRGKWENMHAIDTGDASRVAFLMGDDTPGAALYMYVGTKQASGDFLARNGLKGGKLYVWAANNGDLTAADFKSGQRVGLWKEVTARDQAKAGAAGYDALGYKWDTELAASADAVEAFSFARIEDIARDPGDATRFAFAVTGNSGFDGGSNVAGMLHTVKIDLSGSPTATLRVLYNANTAASQPIRSPDNLAWSADGWLYVQEDKAENIFSSPFPNTRESGILRMNPVTGVIERIATINRGAVDPGLTDTRAGITGGWESTGITDVSVAFGKPAGSLFLTNVLAHGVVAGSKVESGQMLLLSKPGGDQVPGVSIIALGAEREVKGSAFSDRIIGDAAANWLSGAKGDDRIYGGAGADTLFGGAGHDGLTGGVGADHYTYTNPAQGGDAVTYFSSADVFRFWGENFGLGSFAGPLAAGRFQARADNKAQDTNDRFIFRTGDDTLWWDSDGTGSKGPVLIADMSNNFSLTAADILIV